jgi:hypothetical protein
VRFVNHILNNLSGYGAVEIDRVPVLLVHVIPWNNIFILVTQKSAVGGKEL